MFGEDEAAELDRRGSSRRDKERHQNEQEIRALHQTIDELRKQVDADTKKYERILRDRNASMLNLADAEKGARRQVEELTARELTITQLRDQLDRVTAESNKKSTKIEDIRNDSSKKSSKVNDLRNQRTGLRNRLDEQAALHQAALEEKDSELTKIRELLDTCAQDITTLEASSREIREERERLQFRYNELGLSMVTAQEELDEARTLAPWQQRV